MPKSKPKTAALDFADRLKSVFDAAGVKPRGRGVLLMKLFGISNATASAYINGNHMPEPEKVRVLAAKYGVDYEWLYFGKGAQPGVKAQSERLTKDGSIEPASPALGKYRGFNDVVALQEIIGILVGHMLATRPDEAQELVDSLDELDGKWKATGPGEALLLQLAEVRPHIAKAKVRRARKPRGI